MAALSRWRPGAPPRLLVLLLPLAAGATPWVDRYDTTFSSPANASGPAYEAGRNRQGFRGLT